MKKLWLSLALLCVGVVALLSSCGDMPIKKNLPDSIRKVFIPTFENKANQPGIESLLTQKTVQNFIVDGRLQVVAKEQADAELIGTIQRYDRLVLTRDANQVPQQYKLQVAVDLDFVDLKSGKQDALWTTRQLISLTPGVEPSKDDFDSTNTHSLREFTTYYVLNVAGVPPEDEPAALDRLLEQMARRVVGRTLDGF